tara:strand:+ start:7705 stop:8979 length:1275 start_codon:yes stop_codon:yes gene_type:complete
MTVEFKTRLLIGDISSETDFTDRLMGMKIDQPIRLSRASQHTAVLTLKNYDGALTPGAGGTYTNTDWFSQAVVIDFSDDAGTTYSRLFAGVITDFRLRDNGVFSTVEIQVHDWLMFLGRATGSLTTTAGPLTDAIRFALEELVDNTTEMPTFAGTIEAVTHPQSGSSTNATVNITGIIGNDFNNSLTASNLCAVWSNDIDMVRTGTPKIQMEAVVVGDQLGYSMMWPRVGGVGAYTTSPVQFVEGTPGSGQIPFTALDVGFKFELLANRAEVTRDGSTKQSDVNQTSVSKYGARTVISSKASSSTDDDALSAAKNIVNRQSDTPFSPRTLTFTAADCNGLDAATGDNIRILLNTRACGFQPLTVTYTPTGAASAITANCMTFGRTITAVPGKFRVTLHLLPAQDFGSFVLDSTFAGVLDTNRLG